MRRPEFSLIGHLYVNTATTTLSRPARVRREVHSLLALALPIMIGQLATTAMGFVDAVMAGRVLSCTSCRIRIWRRTTTRSLSSVR